MIRARLIAFALLALVNASALAAESQGGPWTDPEVLKAALAIDMTDEQKPKFGDGVTGFFNCYMAALKKVMAGRDNVDLERKMKSKTNSCVRKMDEAMSVFLTEEQLPKYAIYRDTLTDKLREM